MITYYIYLEGIMNKTYVVRNDDLKGDRTNTNWRQIDNYVCIYIYFTWTRCGRDLYATSVSATRDFCFLILFMGIQGSFRVIQKMDSACSMEPTNIWAGLKGNFYTAKLHPLTITIISVEMRIMLMGFYRYYCDVFFRQIRVGYKFIASKFWFCSTPASECVHKPQVRRLFFVRMTP